MKRKITVLFLLFVFMGTAFSVSNLQKSYLMSDDVWMRTARLARTAGQLGPTPVSPSSGYQILQALERIDYEHLSIRQKEEWDELYSILTGTDRTGVLAFGDDVALFDINIGLNYEAYGFNNLKSTYADEFFVPFRDRQPLLALGFDALFGNALLFVFEYRLQDSPMGFELWPDGSLKQGDLFYYFHNASILFSPGLDGKMHYLANWDKRNVGYNFFNSQPVRVGASLSNDYMSLFIGRTRHQFGSGVTGNMVIGDNFTYQELVQFSAYSSVFSYTLSLTHFDNTEYYGKGLRYSTTLSGLHQNRLIHRFDIVPLDSLRISFNIGAMFLTDSAFDLRLLNPMMIVHNWGNNYESVEIKLGDEANNIMGFELECAICSNFSAGAQLVIDQMAVHGEVDSSVPMAIGGLLNARYTHLLEDNGYIDAYAEVVYTSPYLYLNEKTVEVADGVVVDNMLDYIVGYGYQDNRTIEANYSGHSFGPDTFAFCIGSEYESYERWNASGSMLFKMHGENGITRPYWNQNDSNRGGSNSLGLTGTPEFTFRIDLGGGYRILDSLEVSLKTANIFQWNYHNVEGKFKYSFQAAFGLGWIIF